VVPKKIPHMKRIRCSSNEPGQWRTLPKVLRASVLDFLALDDLVRYGRTHKHATTETPAWRITHGWPYPTSEQITTFLTRWGVHTRDMCLMMSDHLDASRWHLPALRSMELMTSSAMSFASLLRACPRLEFLTLTAPPSDHAALLASSLQQLRLLSSLQHETEQATLEYIKMLPSTLCSLSLSGLVVSATVFDRLLTQCPRLTSLNLSIRMLSADRYIASTWAPLARHEWRNVTMQIPFMDRSPWEIVLDITAATRPNETLSVSMHGLFFINDVLTVEILERMVQALGKERASRLRHLRWPNAILSGKLLWRRVMECFPALVTWPHFHYLDEVELADVVYAQQHRWPAFEEYQHFWDGRTPQLISSSDDWTLLPSVLHTMAQTRTRIEITQQCEWLQRNSDILSWLQQGRCWQDVFITDPQFTLDNTTLDHLIRLPALSILDLECLHSIDVTMVDHLMLRKHPPMRVCLRQVVNTEDKILLSGFTFERVRHWFERSDGVRHFRCEHGAVDLTTVEWDRIREIWSASPRLGHHYWTFWSRPATKRWQLFEFERSKGYR
jgi:hypothetical protein